MKNYEFLIRNHYYEKENRYACLTLEIITFKYGAWNFVIKTIFKYKYSLILIIIDGPEVSLSLQRSFYFS